VNMPDLRRQARALGEHAADLTPEQLSAWGDLRGALALALHGQSPELAAAFHDAVLACIAGEALLPRQRADLTTPLLVALVELGADADTEAPALLPGTAPRALQAVP
jgi:hypothetical protein